MPAPPPPLPSAPTPLTFSTLTRHGATNLDPYRPAVPGGPAGWQHAQRLLAPHLPTLGLEHLVPVGEGELGWVFRARQTAAARLVAVKIGKADGVTDTEGRLLAQAAVMSRLDHPGVPRVLATGRLPGSETQYLLLEWIDGANLEVILASHLDAAHARRVLAALVDVALALQHGHDRGQLHLDVRAANILVPHEASRPAALVDWRGHGPAETSSARDDVQALATIARSVLAASQVAGRHDLTELTTGCWTDAPAAARGLRRILAALTGHAGQDANPNEEREHHAAG